MSLIQKHREAIVSASYFNILFCLQNEIAWLELYKKAHQRQNQLPIEIEITQTFFTLQFDGKTVLQHTFCCYVCILKSIICNCKLVFLSAVYTSFFDLNSLCYVECLQVTMDLANFWPKKLKIDHLWLAQNISKKVW